MQKGITAKIFFSEIFCFSCMLDSYFTKMTKILQQKITLVSLRPMTSAIFDFIIMGPISFFQNSIFMRKLEIIYAKIFISYSVFTYPIFYTVKHTDAIPPTLFSL